jgi:hypothetical protein
MLLALAVSLLSLGASAAEPALDPAIQVLAEKVASLDAPDPALIAKASSLFNKKCWDSDIEGYTQGCYLSPKELGLIPNFRNSVLLFRGERRRFELPGTSTLLRAVIAGSAFCKSECSYEKMANALKSSASRLQGYVKPQQSVFLLSGEQDWSVASQADFYAAREAQRPLQTGSDPTPGKGYSLLEWLTSSHFDSFDLVINDPKIGATLLDAYVSLSAGPGAAMQFGGKGSGPDGGRILVLEVPRDRLVDYCARDRRGRLSRADSLPDRDQIGNFRACDTRARVSYQGEAELDSLFFVNSDYVIRSVTAWTSPN